MVRTTTVAAGAMLLALAACGAGDDAINNQVGNGAEAAPEANAAAAANTAGDKDPAVGSATDRPSGTPGPGEDGGPRAVASSPSSEIRALLIGRWTDSGDCAAATEFRADGTFTSPVGAGRWTLEREYLTLSGAGPDAEVAVQEVDRREMDTISPTGRIGRWTRC